jgi:hypothetical protein
VKTQLTPEMSLDIARRHGMFILTKGGNFELYRRTYHHAKPAFLGRRRDFDGIAQLITRCAGSKGNK